MQDPYLLISYGIQKTQSHFLSSPRVTSSGQQVGTFFDGNKQGPYKTIVCPKKGIVNISINVFISKSSIDWIEHVKYLKFCFNCLDSHHVQRFISKKICLTVNCCETVILCSMKALQEAIESSAVIKYLEQDEQPLILLNCLIVKREKTSTTEAAKAR